MNSTNIFEIYLSMLPWFLLACGIVCLMTKWDFPKYVIVYKWGRVQLKKVEEEESKNELIRPNVETGKKLKKEEPIEVIWEGRIEEKKAISYEWKEEGEWRIRKEIVQN